MPKITVAIGDDSHEVDVDSLTFPEGYRVLAPGQVPDGMFSQETLDAKIKDRLRRERQTLESDPEFTRSILERQGVPLDEDGKVAIPKREEIDEDAIREKLKGAIKREELDPLRQENEVLSGRVNQLLGARKRAEVLAAANKAKVKDGFLTSPVEGEAELILNIVGPYIGYDDERDFFAVKQGDSFKPSTKEGKPWAGISDLFDQLKKDPAYAYLFRDDRPGSHGIETGGGKSSIPGFPSKKADFRPSQKVAFIEEHGRDAYDKLP